MLWRNLQLVEDSQYVVEVEESHISGITFVGYGVKKLEIVEYLFFIVILGKIKIIFLFGMLDGYCGMHKNIMLGILNTLAILSLSGFYFQQTNQIKIWKQNTDANYIYKKYLIYFFERQGQFVGC